MDRLRSERGIAALIAVCLLLLAATTVLATIAVRKTAELANPSDQQVVDRLKRGVRVMSKKDARLIIGTMTRKAAR